MSDQSLTANQNAGIVTYAIKINGKTINDSIQTLSIEVTKAVNQIPTATLVFLDGDPAMEDFELSSQDLFIPGANIEISVGYDMQESVVFKGIITAHSISINSDGSQLRIECKDAIFSTTLTRQCRNFTEMSDSQVIQNILSEYPITSEITSSNVVHQKLTQYDVSDWDFMLNRADVNGMIGIADDGKFSVQPPDVSESSILTLTYGDSIYEFNAKMDATLQPKGVTALAWDSTNQKNIKVKASEPNTNDWGNLTAKKLSSSIKSPIYEMRHGGDLPKDELKAWADAKLLRQRFAKIRGQIKFQGIATVKPNTIIELKGVGKRFSGKAYVSAVHHKIAKGDWLTEATLGLDAKWLENRTEEKPLLSTQLIPAIAGLQVGIVVPLENDQTDEDRIKIILPTTDEKDNGIWARLAHLNAGKQRDESFRPKVDDEVIVGFINDDPRQAVVLGIIHSSQSPTPETNSDDEEKKVIHLKTSAGNEIKLDDEHSNLILADQNGNKIILDRNGIKIESNSNIFLDAKGNLTAKGLNIDLAAKATLKANGNAGAELSANGITTIKGALVRIN